MQVLYSTYLMLISSRRSARVKVLFMPLLFLAIFLPSAILQEVENAALESAREEHVRARLPEGIKAGALIANLSALLQLELPDLAEPDALQVRPNASRSLNSSID